MLTLKLTFLYIPKIHTQTTQHLLAPLLIANKCRTNICSAPNKRTLRVIISQISTSVIQFFVLGLLNLICRPPHPPNY